MTPSDGSCCGSFGLPLTPSWPKPNKDCDEFGCRLRKPEGCSRDGEVSDATSESDRLHCDDFRLVKFWTEALRRGRIWLVDRSNVTEERLSCSVSSISFVTDDDPNREWTSSSSFDAIVIGLASIDAMMTPSTYRQNDFSSKSLDERMQAVHSYTIAKGSVFVAWRKARWH